MWNRLALLGQQARIQSFWRDVFSLSHTRAPPASPAQLVEVTPKNSTQDKRALLQSCVLRLGFFQDGDVGVGVFPEGEEIFVGGQRPDAGGIGICSLRGSRLQGIGTRHSQMRQRSRPAVPDDTAVVDDFLELGGGLCALSGCQVCL